MSLEKWEIDLRKQLEGKIVDTKQNKPELLNDTMLMVVLLVILSLALLFAYDYKTGHIQGLFKAIPSSNAAKEEVKDLGMINALSDLIRDEIDKAKIDKQSFEGVISKTQSNTDRVTLMGIMLNENFCILRNNLPKGDMIFLNQDWTLNDMPKHIKLSDKDKEYLQKFIKHQ